MRYSPERVEAARRARHGDATYEERFWSQVDASGDCWEWTGYTDPGGYGRFGGLLTYRRSHEMLVGPVPTGLELDHLCRNKRCVNPDHLEPVTHRENVLRGYSPQARAARKTHCPSGHSLADAYVDRDGSRHCRPCGLARGKRDYERRKARAAA